MKKRLLAATIVGLSLLSASAAFAQPPDEDGSNPRREEFCKNNPATCQHMKEERDEHKKWCETHKDECTKLKAEHQARMEKRREKMKEKCAANPTECEKKKEEFRERMKERHEHQEQSPTPSK